MAMLRISILKCRFAGPFPIFHSVSTQLLAVLTTIFMILNLKTDFKSFYVKSYLFWGKLWFQGLSGTHSLTFYPPGGKICPSCYVCHDAASSRPLVRTSSRLFLINSLASPETLSLLFTASTISCVRGGISGMTDSLGLRLEI